MKIDQKDLNETWDLFINMTKDHDNDTKDKFIQLRDKLQKEIDEKGYADTNDPKLTEWWLGKKQMPKNIIKNQVIKHMNFKELILRNHENATIVNCKMDSLKMINCKKCTIVGNIIKNLSMDDDSIANFFGVNIIYNRFDKNKGLIQTFKMKFQ